MTIPNTRVGWQRCAAAAFASAMLTNPVMAQDQQITEIQQTQMFEDVGAGARINLSGKLRMLSQRIPGAACYYEEGIKTDDSGAMQLVARSAFAQEPQ